MISQIFIKLSHLYMSYLLRFFSFSRILLLWWRTWGWTALRRRTRLIILNLIVYLVTFFLTYNFFNNYWIIFSRLFCLFILLFRKFHWLFLTFSLVLMSIKLHIFRLILEFLLLCLIFIGIQILCLIKIMMSNWFPRGILSLFTWIWLLLKFIILFENRVIWDT